MVNAKTLNIAGIIDWKFASYFPRIFEAPLLSRSSAVGGAGEGLDRQCSACGIYFRTRDTILQSWMKLILYQ